MGIRRLTQYVEDLPHGKGKVWDNFDLRETKVVIDGNGLYHYIYSDINHLNTKYGGQYDEFQVKMKEFFRKLQSNNVEPYVVIDGIMSRDEKKLETHIKRKTETIEQVEKMWKFNKSDDETNERVFPLLAQLVFVQVLREMKVHYAVADFEADWEIASLANELDAPVMGKDCDFYVFNIKKGYIPFEEFFTSQNTRVKKFSFDGFVQYVKQQFAIDSEMLPLLASLLGNDYISGDLLRKFHDSLKLDTNSKKVPIIASFLSQYQSISDACGAVIELYQNDSAEFAEALFLSIEEYQKTGSNLIHYFNSDSLSCKVRTYNGHPLPKWVVKLYREGLIASEGLHCLCNRKVSLRPQSERISLPSTHTCAEGLRQYYYKLALSWERIVVTEYDREKSSFPPKEKMLTLQTKPQIHDLSHMSYEEKRICLLKLLDRNPDLPVEDNQPVVSEDNPLVVSENNQRVASEDDPLVVSENNQRVASEDDPLVVSENNQRVASEDNQLVVSENNQRVASEDDPLVVSENNQRVASEDNPLVVSENNQRVASEDDPLVVSENNQRVASEDNQLVVSALKYWCQPIHSQHQVRPEHLAAILVYYVGEKRSQTTSDDTSKITVYEVHGFSQWQNVLYWVERLNALFSYPFPPPKLVKLYDGVHVCLLYHTFKEKGIEFADNIVTDKTLYRNLYERITKDLGSHWQIKQPQSSQKQPNKGSAKLEKQRKTKGESSEGSCKNRFELLDDGDDDDDEYDESC